MALNDKPLNKNGLIFLRRHMSNRISLAAGLLPHSKQVTRWIESCIFSQNNIKNEKQIKIISQEFRIYGGIFLCTKEFFMGTSSDPHLDKILATLRVKVSHKLKTIVFSQS